MSKNGWTDASTAMLDALDFDVQLLTTQAALYAGMPGQDRINELSPGD